MLEEALAYLVPPDEGSLLLDCTLGEGGHAEAFLARYPSLRCLGVDADPSIQAKARERLAPFGERVAFRLGYFDEVLADWDALDLNWRGQRPSLVLFDLGISMYHFAESGRGFGHGRDEVLDMRLSPEAPRSAADILAQESEFELARIIFEYGEERMSRRIARAIVEARRRAPVATTGALAELVWAAVPPSYRHGRIHPATRTFQALRIAVNDELARAERGIRLAASLLTPGGVMAVIAFHSLEDRVAKRTIRELAGHANGHEAGAEGRGAASLSTSARNSPISEGKGGRVLLELVTKKPLEPKSEEVARNPASRSAKMRVARKVLEAGDRGRRTAA